MTDDDTDRPDGTETDWLANSAHGYGFGYTREQALAAMLRHVRPENVPDDGVPVMLVEHVGDATVTPSRVDVDTHVQTERVTITAEHAERAVESTRKAHAAVTRALDHAEERDD